MLRYGRGCLARAEHALVPVPTNRNACMFINSQAESASWGAPLSDAETGQLMATHSSSVCLPSTQLTLCCTSQHSSGVWHRTARRQGVLLGARPCPAHNKLGPAPTCLPACPVVLFLDTAR